MDNLNNAIALPRQKDQSPLRVLKPEKKFIPQRLAVTTNNEIKLIPFGDILYCRAINNYTSVVTHDGSSFLCCKTLRHIEAKLPQDSFFRIHQSYVINLHCITSLSKRQSELEIAHKTILPISRSKKQAVLKIIHA